MILPVPLNICSKTAVSNIRHPSNAHKPSFIELRNHLFKTVYKHDNPTAINTFNIPED